MNIIIKTIPHSDQRYPTVGDYWTDPDGTLQVRVSEMGNEYYESLVAIHELWEELLCRKRKIPEDEITNFDVAFENVRPPGNTDEPGDEPTAPYHREHCSASGVERILCAELGIAWRNYCETVERL